MKVIFFFIVFLWISLAAGWSEEAVQEPVHPVARDAKNANEANDGRNTPPERTFPIINNIYIGEKREVQAKHRNSQPDEKSSVGADWVAIFTGLLVLVTGGLVYVAWKQNKSIRTIERAYVTLSHAPLQQGAFDKMIGRFRVTTQAKNFGKTPATLRKTILIPIVLPDGHSLPKVPDYHHPERKRLDLNVFLVATDACLAMWEIPLDLADISEIESGGKRLWLYGHIDYRDQFGQSHRAGYARVYDPKNNLLVFVTQDGYNYDCQRKKDEDEAN